jgi:hypothetical protein
MTQIIGDLVLVRVVQRPDFGDLALRRSLSARQRRRVAVSGVCGRVG